jgi:hypothetical protein
MRRSLAAIKERLRGTAFESVYRFLRDDVWRASRSYDLVLARRRASVQRSWNMAGRPGSPPAEVKQLAVLAAGREYGLRTLVETGTYLGGTVLAARRRFDRIISIELDPTLAANTRRLFARAKNVTILEGDSGKLLPDVAARIEEPVLWWLDGHYSGPGTALGDRPTPVIEELLAIIAHPVHGHLVLIDDARLFTGDDYPSLDELAELVAPRFDMSVVDDIIRLTERGQRTS